tara:strand:- start:1852 stop:2349 length:498 start_codon:yes stop_codon:yes gene_type:complete
MGKINSPELINKTHQVDQFESGEITLDHWLKKRALKNQENGASTTFVIHQQKEVIGYYALATGSVIAKHVPSKLKRNMPDPIPVIVLGRLAVRADYQHQGLGRSLLKDAVLRALRISQEVGVKAMLVHALSEQAKHFYKRFGFVESPLDPMLLMLSLKRQRDNVK